MFNFIYNNMKYLKDKNKVYENWLNPQLDGSYIDSSGNLVQGCNNNTPLIYQDQPDWLNIECENDIDYDKVEGNFGNVGPLSIATYYINGQPMTSWSARMGGNHSTTYKHNLSQSFYYMDAVLKRLFPNGVNLNIKKEEIIEYSIDKLKIIKMLPVQNGLAFDVFITFTLKDIDNEFWGKFVNVGLDREPKFQCAEIKDIAIEEKLKIKGKLWNLISDWFSVKSGIYKVIADDMLVYTEFGQLKKLVKDNIIEVNYSDNEKIKLTFDNKLYIIKKPTYYWFNWYTQKI